MAKPKNLPKSGGRKEGTPNKRTLEAREIAEKLGVNPLEICLMFAAGDWEGLGYPSADVTKVLKDGGTINVDTIPPELRQKSAKDVLGYLFPQLKAIELTGKDGGPLSIEEYLKNILNQKPQEK